MKNAQELRKSFAVQNKIGFSKESNDDSDDEKISSTPEIRKDNVLSQYFNNLRNLFDAFNKSGTVVTVLKLKNIKNSYFKQADKRAFERNVDDNDKNIFFYLTYIKFDSELVAFFTELCTEANQLGLGSNPLWHELGRYGNHKLTPLEHALARNNVPYAFSIAAQMLLTYDLETLKFVVTRIDRKDLAAESMPYIENCKKLNYLILCQLLFNFNKYSIQNKDYIVDCIISLINDGHISTNDSYNFIQQIEASKKDAYSENKGYTLPLLHRIARLGNIDPTRCQKILRSITKEKLMELNKETIKENGDTTLLSFAFYINNKNAIEVFKTLLILLDPTVRSESKGSNVFHKLMRNLQLSIIPDILTMMFTSLDLNLLKDLWLSPDKDNYFPLAELIPGRTKTPKKTNSRGELPIPDAQLNTFAETDYSASIPILRRIVDAFPEICKIPLGANDETLLMHAIKNKSLQKIIPDIILKSDPDHKNKQGQDARQIAVIFNVQLDEFIQKARTQKDQDYSYYKTKEDYEKVCEERDNCKEAAEKYRNQRNKYQDDLKKSQTELSELTQEHDELKRKYEEISKKSETSEKNLQRIRQQRKELEEEINKLKLENNSKKLKLSQDELLSKEHDEKIKKLSNEKDKLYTELQKTKAKLFESENQYNELKQQSTSDEKAQQSVELMSATIKQYQNLAEASKQASTKLTEEVNLLKEQKQLLESANDQLKVTLNNRETELASYKEIHEKLTESNKELDIAKQQNLALQQQLEQLKKQYEDSSKKQQPLDEVNVVTETAPAMQPFSFSLGFDSPIRKTSSAPIFGQYPSTVFHSSDKNKRKFDDANNSSDEEKPSDKKKPKKNVNAEDTNQSVECDQIIQELLQDPSLENFLTQEPSLDLDKEKNCDTNKPKNPQNDKFVPQFFPQNLKYNKENLKTVSASAKKPTPVKPVKTDSIHPKKKRKKLPQQTAYAIGRLGERAAYEILKDYYLQRYDENYPPIDEKKTDKYRITTQEITTGFVLTGFDKTDKPVIILEIIWHNKNMPENEDSGQHHDMHIRRTGGKGNKQRYIEIKSTTKNSKSQVKLTAQEWLELIEHKYNFRLYRVFNVKTKPRIEKHKMYEELLQDKLPISGIKLSL